MSTDLEISWKSITSDMPKPVSDWWWSLLLKKFTEGGRNTHDLHYLQEKFKELDLCKGRIKNFTAFGLALFFQYFNYNARDAECYSKNIDVFKKFATEANIPEDTELFRQVRFLLEASTIHSTEEHKIEGAYGESDLHYFLDVDMAILGGSEENYNKYIQDLHKEYSFLDSSSYKSLRKKEALLTEDYLNYLQPDGKNIIANLMGKYMCSKKTLVLQSFLLIPNIFATKEFRDKYELQARKNIQQELSSL